MMKGNGAKIVSSALLGLDGVTIVVGGKVYFVAPPTIKRIAGAGYHLSSFNEDSEVFASISSATKALSWLIQGDESLAEALMEGTIEEVSEGLKSALSLLDTRSFLELSSLARSVQSLIAKQRQ